MVTVKTLPWRIGGMRLPIGRFGAILCLSSMMLFNFKTIIGQSDRFFNQAEDIRIETVDLPELGITNEAQDIWQDASGILWIGTARGLVRYDGHRTKRYFHDPNRQSSISNNDISSLYQSDTNHLWVGTFENGLNKMDIARESFSRYLDDIVVTLVVGTRGGDLLIGTHIGLFLLDPITDSLSHFQPYKGDDREGVNQIWAILEDSNGVIWLGTGPLLGGKGGLLSFELEKDTFLTHSIQTSMGDHISDVPVISLLEDSRNQLWWGTSRGHLFKKDLLTGTYQQIMLDPPLDVTTWITHLFEDFDGNIWIGTDRQGIYLYEPESGRQKHFDSKSSDVKLPNDASWRIFQSRDSVLWVTSAKRGARLCKIYLDPPLIKEYSLPEISTYAFVEGTSQDELWIGTNNGLILYHLQDGIQKHYSQKFFLPGIEKDIVFHSLQQDKEGNLWAALIAKEIQHSPGVLRFNPTTGESTIFSSVDGDGNSLSHHWVFDLMIDSKDRIWVGTHGGGLNLFDPTLGGFTHYRHDPDNPSSLEADYVISLFDDRDGKIWITGYMSSVYPAPGHQRIKYVNAFSPDEETFFRVRLHPPYDRTNRSFEGISQDSDGNIWLQTRNDGIIRLDSMGVIDDVFKPFNSSQNVVSSIMVEDQFWMIREHSIFRCDPDEGKISSDVLEYRGSVQEIGQFYFSTAKLTNRNTILMGGDNFFYEVMTRGTMTKSSGSIAFSDIHLLSGNNRDRAELKEALSKRELVLNHQENNFTVSFFLSDYHAPNRNIFHHKMQGFDDTWQQVRYLPEATYRKIPPGGYELHVWSTGYRSDIVSESSLSILILPPWWQRWWAYALFLLGGILLLTAAYLIQRRRWLLQTRLQLEKEKANKLRELDEYKNRFYTNITHEFRTPLTVIKGMADHIIGQNRVRELIRRNSDQLLNMVNQLLDLTKVESGGLSISWVQGDIVPYLQYLTESCHSLALEKRISLSFFIKEENIIMDFDGNIIQHILINLISNAIKFTPEYGSVKVTVDVQGDATTSQLVMGVRDTGVGIPRGELQHIFNRFYQIDHKVASREEERESPSEMRLGSGIGLALVKELVQILDGKIEVESEIGKGSSFTVFLPIHLEAAQHFIPSDFVEQHPGNQHKAGEWEAEVKPESLAEQQPEVLIIEDNSDVKEYIMMCLQSKYMLYTARNGMEGVSKAKELVPDVIISDVMMPEMDGFEVCRVVKSNRTTSHIPVILLTAKATMQDKISGLERGADAYLTKPFNKDELLLRIENLLSLTSKLRQKLSDATISLSEADGLEKSESAFILEVNEVIETNMTNEMFDTHQLCRSMAMSRTQLHRKLKALTGQPTASYIRTAKLRKAKMLLEKTDQSIAEVATEVGYKDPSHFSRSFGKEFGMLPSEFRDRSQ